MAGRASALANGSDGSNASARTRAPSSLEREAFESFPYGLLVLDRNGRVVSCNLEASRLIRELGLSDSELTCCELLGCGRPHTVLAHGCLTKLALRQPGVLPEVRVEVKGSSGPAALWVAGGAVGSERQRVVLQLRAGAAGDRRQRTDPNWRVGPKLRIRTLGRTVVESSGRPIGGAWLDQRAGQLLKYLVAERHRAVTTDEIGESIWKNADFAVAGSVRFCVHGLRRKLEPQRGPREPSRFIIASAGAYRLKLDQIELDVEEFEGEVLAGLGALPADPATATRRLEAGLGLYRGEFLADVPFAEWAAYERHRLHDLASRGLRALADLHLQAVQPDSARRSLARLAALQPYDEDVHRRLMELEISHGHASDAIRRYAALRSRFRRTFGHDPRFTPADLVRASLPT
jgi:DNA-binding SARP family transcriptional activator